MGNDRSEGVTSLCFPSRDSRIGGVGDKADRRDDTGLHPVVRGAGNPRRALGELKDQDTCRLKLCDPETAEILGDCNILTETLTFHGQTQSAPLFPGFHQPRFHG